MNLGKESEVLEFKESTGERKEACESIVAMVNKHGYGVLYFGVFDNGDIKGQMVSDSTLRDIAETITREIEPKITPTIQSIVIEGKNIIKINFSGTQKPYSAYGKFLIRVGTQNRKMSRDELVRLIKENDYSLNWEKETTKCSLEEIDDETLKRFYRESVNCGRLEMEEYNKTSLLTILGLLSNGMLTNAGKALFGKNANIGLKVASFATDEKITFNDLKLFKGNIYNLINEAMTYLKNKINWRVEIESTKRYEKPEIPIAALREMVINAFAHANYKNDPEIEINIHPNKITIFNPGSFPDNLTPYDFIEKDISSIKRNPLILETLFRCKDVEKSGTGYKRMNKLCLEENIKWSFENTAYGFYFTFYRNVEQPHVLVTDYIEELNEEEKIILRLIKEDSKILKTDLAKAINKSEKTVQRHTNSLIEKGYLLRIGNNQYGYWEVLK